MLKSTFNLFNKAKKEMTKLNTDFEKISLLNKTKSDEIRNSIEKKSIEISQKKTQRNKHFNFIHKK